MRVADAWEMCPLIGCQSCQPGLLRQRLSYSLSWEANVIMKVGSGSHVFCSLLLVGRAEHERKGSGYHLSSF